MKYMLLIYGNQELWASYSPDEHQKAIGDMEEWITRSYASGELLGAYGLADAAAAKTVRVTAGVPAVTDGPYLETKEYLASYYLIDVEDEQRALAMAAENPWSSEGAMEVWPVLHESAPR